MANTPTPEPKKAQSQSQSQKQAQGSGEPVHRFSCRVYYEDTDFSGVVYHARYLHFLERARSEALRAAGVTHSDLLARREPLAFAVRHMAIDWLAPARIDDVLEVDTVFAPFKGARMPMVQTITCRGETLLTAEVLAVCMSLDGRPRRLPGDLLALLTA